MKRAIDYAHLIGKYVRMEKDGYDLDGHLMAGAEGMEAFVVAVWDVTTKDGRRAVVISGDEGMGYTVYERDEDDWHFAVTAGESYMHSLAKYQRIPQTFGYSQDLCRRTEA